MVVTHAMVAVMMSVGRRIVVVVRVVARPR